MNVIQRLFAATSFREHEASGFVVSPSSLTGRGHSSPHYPRPSITQNARPAATRAAETTTGQRISFNNPPSMQKRSPHICWPTFLPRDNPLAPLMVHHPTGGANFFTQRNKRAQQPLRQNKPGPGVIVPRGRPFTTKTTESPGFLYLPGAHNAKGRSTGMLPRQVK